MGIHSTPTQNAIQKTVDSTFAAGASTIVLNEDVSSLFSGVSSTNPGVFVVDRVDSTGSTTPTKREYCTFTGVSSATLTGCVRNADGSGSDQEHAVGAIVEFVPDVVWATSIKTTFEIEHDGDGTHDTTKVVDLTTAQVLTNKTLTSPVINTQISGSAFLDEDDLSSDSAVKVSSQQSIKAYVDSFNTATITFIIDGGGTAITTGIKGDMEIPFGATIDSYTALADQSGSIVVDIWKDTYANFPPTDADSITASAPVTISTAVKAQDATLTGWTTAITAGDILRFNVDSVTDIERLTISLNITK